MEYLNTKSKNFVVEEKRWYHLKTSRYIEHNDKKYFINTYKVCSENISDLLIFIKKNRIDIDSIHSIDCNDETLLELKQLNKLSKKVAINKGKFPSEDLCESLSVLTLAPSDISLRARVSKIIDGDTIEIVAPINVNELCSKSYINYQVKSQAGISNSKSVLTVKMRCRLFGIDAAEHDTNKGKIATSLLIEISKKYNNILYVHMFGPDKFGRTLIKLFPNEKYSFCINDALLDHRDKEYGKLFIKYDGNTKEKEFHNNSDIPDRNFIPLNILENLPDPIIKTGCTIC